MKAYIVAILLIGTILMSFVDTEFDSSSNSRTEISIDDSYCGPQTFSPNVKTAFQKESDLDNSTRLLEAQQDQGDSTSERQIYFQEVLSFIDSMPRDLRDTLVLIFVVGMNHREASLELGVKESTVSWRVHEARKVLRQKFDSTSHLNSQTPAVGELL